MSKFLGQRSDESFRREGYKWKITAIYNDTVKLPKVPGDLAIEVVHRSDSGKDMEIQAMNSRTDINFIVTEL